MPYTEVKAEVAIDRLTAKATPRQVERVPAGAVFGPFELVFSFYDDDPKQDARRFGYLVEAMQLLEDDYLGGGGSRGSGRIAFTNLSLQVRTAADYRERKARRGLDVSLQGLADLGAEEVVAKLAATMAAANGGA
jgi:CRISPR-associated protein Csm3